MENNNEPEKSDHSEEQGNLTLVLIISAVSLVISVGVVLATVVF